MRGEQEGEPGPDPWSWRLLAASRETQDFAASVRAHLSKIFPIDGLREWISGAAVPDELWQAVADSGYLNLGMPAELDGEGTFLDVLVLLQEAGRAVCPVPLLSAIAAAQAQVAGGLRPDDPARHRSAFGAGMGSATKRHVTSGRIDVLDGATAERLTLL